MNARELHDFLKGSIWLVAPEESNQSTILRALDLLARTEESTDELVRELQQAGDWRTGPGLPLYQRAAATIVALKAERDALLPIYEHAHGMTFGVDWNKGTAAGYHRKKLIKAVEAYRAAQEKP